MNRRLLVVDDDKSMVKTLSDVLRLKGWDVTTAHSGEAAVEIVAGDGIDVVLMDVKMPGMDGVEALKAMKAVRPNIRVVLMTAYAAQDRIAEAERAGVVRVLPKPVNLGALLTLLATTLGARQPVLVVDHDAPFLKTLSEVLETRGFDVAVATDIEHAKQLLALERPLAVLLHMHLGTVSAREAVTAVHHASPAIALVLYSGQPGSVEEARHDLSAEWIHAYLQKPFAVDQIAGVLDDIRKAS
jgi:DNA-binding NtrC family response regulator